MSTRLCGCGYPAKWAVTWPENPYYVDLYCDGCFSGDKLEEDKTNVVRRIWLWEKQEREAEGLV